MRSPRKKRMPANARRSRPTSRSEASMKAMIDHAKAKWGRIDVLHYNVGFSIAGGDAPPTEITEEAFDRILTVNLRGMVMAVKHVLRSCGAAVRRDPRHLVARRMGEVSVRGLQDLEIRDGRLLPADRDPERRYGIRCNVILPGLMDTPMAVDTRARHAGKPRAEVAAMRDARVPFRRRWAPPGTSQMPRCSSPPTRRTSSPACSCLWTVVRWSISAH